MVKCILYKMVEWTLYLKFQNYTSLYDQKSIPRHGLQPKSSKFRSNDWCVKKNFKLRKVLITLKIIYEKPEN